MCFNKRLRKLRMEQGMYQKQLAEKLGVAESTITHYERGYRKPDHDTLLKIADIFNVSVDYLLGKSNQRDPNWFEKLPPKLQEFVKEENIEYLELAMKVKDEQISAEEADKLIKYIKGIKRIIEEG